MALESRADTARTEGQPMSARLPGLVWALHAWHSRQQATWARNWPWFLLMGVAISWLMMTYTRSQSRVQGLVEKRASNHQPLWCLRDSQHLYYKARPCAFHRHSNTLRALMRKMLPALSPQHEGGRDRASRHQTPAARGCIALALAAPTRAWVHGMEEGGLFSRCTVLVYAGQHHYSSAVSAMHGLDNSYVKRWAAEDGGTLDGELETLLAALPGQWSTIAIITGFEPDAVLQGFVGSLRGGLAEAVVWERNWGAAHPRSLLQELDFFQDLGFAVYMVGVQHRDPTGALDMGEELGPLLRLHADTYFVSYEPADPRMVLTLLAVQEGSALQGVADALALCASVEEPAPGETRVHQKCDCIQAAESCALPADPPSPAPHPSQPPPPPTHPAPPVPPRPREPPTPPAPPSPPPSPPWWDLEPV